MFVVTCGLVSPEPMDNEHLCDTKRTLVDVDIAYDSEGHKGEQDRLPWTEVNATMSIGVFRTVLRSNMMATGRRERSSTGQTCRVMRTCIVDASVGIYDELSPLACGLHDGSRCGPPGRTALP